MTTDHGTRYFRADKPDAFTVSEEQWNRLQEILDAPAKDLPGLRKLLNTPSVFDKPDAAAARAALEDFSEHVQKAIDYTLSLTSKDEIRFEPTISDLKHSTIETIKRILRRAAGV